MKLNPELIDWIHRELLVSIAACDYSGAPLLARCLAIEIYNAGTDTRIYLNASSARTLLTHLQPGQWLAVTMEQPRTHRSLQLKGKVSQIAAMDEVAIAYCKTYQRTFSEGVQEFGFSEAFSNVFIPSPDASATLIECTIAQVFEQSPGTQAGRILERRQ